jgi:GST-like protein
MLTVYTCGGPNPRKVTILLEELHWQYNCKLVDLYLGQNREPEYLAVNPNGRLPALHDDDGPGGAPILIWESGAILQYIAEKAERFLPVRGAARYDVLKWLHFQVSHAPYLGNAHLYRTMYKEAMPFDIKRFTIESRRIYQILEGQLAPSRYVAGTEYSIADMAWYPWIEYHDWQGQSLADFPAISRWFAELRQRPEVQIGASIPWKYGEFGTSDVGKRFKDLINSRLVDPAFNLKATEADAALVNLGI